MKILFSICGAVLNFFTEKLLELQLKSYINQPVGHSESYLKHTKGNDFWRGEANHCRELGEAMQKAANNKIISHIIRQALRFDRFIYSVVKSYLNAIKN